MLRPNTITDAQAEIYRSPATEDRRWQRYFSSTTKPEDALRNLPSSFSSSPVSVSHSASMLDSFPVELLFLIKDQIPEIELRTHVCFSQVLGRATKTVYNDAYWERACVRFGLGLAADEDAEKVCWRDVVYDLIRVDGFCTHPQCGVSRLEQNCKSFSEYCDQLRVSCGSTDRAMSKIYMKDFTRKSLTEVLDGHSPYTFSGFITTNTLFANLEFNQDAFTHAINDGYLLVRGSQMNSFDPGSPLSRHPIACRSFATFPPSSTFQLATLGSFPIIHNPHGVTVWDVFAAVQSRYGSAVDASLHHADHQSRFRLDSVDTVYRMHEYLRYVDYCKALSNRVDDMSYLLNRLTTLRDFFHFLYVPSSFSCYLHDD